MSLLSLPSVLSFLLGFADRTAVAGYSASCDRHLRMSDDSARRFTLKSAMRDSSLELVAAGEFDMAAAFSFESSVDAHLSTGMGQSVVLGSRPGGFRGLCWTRRPALHTRDHARRRGIELRYGGVSGPARTILALTGIGAGD